MSQKALVPWAMPELGKEVLSKARVEMVPLHGPKGQLPALEELIETVRDVHVLISRALQPVPGEEGVTARSGGSDHGKSKSSRYFQLWSGV